MSDVRCKKKTAWDWIPERPLLVLISLLTSHLCICPVSHQLNESSSALRHSWSISTHHLLWYSESLFDIWTLWNNITNQVKFVTIDTIFHLERGLSITGSLWFGIFGILTEDLINGNSSFSVSSYIIPLINPANVQNLSIPKFFY